MKVSMSTGGVRDYIRFTADTTAECCQLSRVALSKFMPEDKVYLNLADDQTIALIIWTSEKRPAAITPEVKSEIDATP